MTSFHVESLTPGITRNPPDIISGLPELPSAPVHSRADRAPLRRLRHGNFTKGYSGEGMMSNCNFRVGQKVVCVNADRAKNLSYGLVYTIKKIRFQDHPVLALTGKSTDQAIELFEAEPNSPSHLGFCPSRFRPAVQRKTDISCFEAMLNPSRSEVPA